MRCDECRYDYDEAARDDVARRIRALGSRYDALLNRDAPVLRAKPAPDVWSPLEYGCHIRDVLRTQRDRVARALVEDTPVFTPMGRDKLAIEHAYNEQDPVSVRAEILEAADALAVALEALDEDGWNRSGVYTYPTEAVRTIEWIGRHTIHEGMHHLLDIERQLS